VPNSVGRSPASLRARFETILTWWNQKGGVTLLLPTRNLKVTIDRVLRSSRETSTKNFHRQFNTFIGVSAGHSLLACSLLYV
jgi:hypothetical protein